MFAELGSHSALQFERLSLTLFLFFQFKKKTLIDVDCKMKVLCFWRPLLKFKCLFNGKLKSSKIGKSTSLFNLY